MHIYIQIDGLFQLKLRIFETGDILRIPQPYHHCIYHQKTLKKPEPKSVSFSFLTHWNVQQLVNICPEKIPILPDLT